MSGIKLGIRVAQINKTVPALKEVKTNRGDGQHLKGYQNTVAEISTGISEALKKVLNTGDSGLGISRKLRKNS